MATMLVSREAIGYGPHYSIGEAVQRLCDPGFCSQDTEAGLAALEYQNRHLVALLGGMLRKLHEKGLFNDDDLRSLLDFEVVHTP